MSTWLLLLALGAPETVDLRFVDLQRAVLASSEGQQAKARLQAARARSQAAIDARRARLLADRAGLSEAELGERTRALEAEIDAAEQALEAMQEGMLAPILARFDGVRRGLEAPGRVVVRLDEAPLLGWPQACDLTETLLARANGEKGGPVGARPRCRAGRLRRVDLPPLAAASSEARAQAAKVESFRKQQQASIDEARARLARAGKGDAEARAALDKRVSALRAALAERKRAAEDAVFDALVQQLGRAARSLKRTAVVEATEVELPLPVEDGQAWARSVLGIRSARK